MSRKTEIQVGVTVLVAIAVLLWGVAWLSALARSHLQRTWHVSFAQAAGLAEGNEAHVNGVRKGVVRALRLSGDHVIVDLALARDVVLTRDSRVVIRSVSMMGDKVIAVDYRGTGAPWSRARHHPRLLREGPARGHGRRRARLRRRGRHRAAARQPGAGGQPRAAGWSRRSRASAAPAPTSRRRWPRTARRCGMTMDNLSATSGSAQPAGGGPRGRAGRGARPLRLGGGEPRPALGPARLAARLAAGHGVAARPRRGHARPAGAGREALRRPRRRRCASCAR